MAQDLAGVDAHIGSKLRQLRVANNLTEEQFANRFGIAVAHVQMYEQGEKRVPPRHLIQAAELFKVSIGWFFEEAAFTCEPQKLAQPNAEIVRFLAMPESFALISAFVAIPSIAQRQAVVAFAMTASQTKAIVDH